MWAKTSAGFIGGLFISISVLTAMYYIVPLEADGRIMLGVILGWVVWAAVMVWSYASATGFQAWKRCGGLLLLTAVLNIGLFFTQA